MQSLFSRTENRQWVWALQLVLATFVCAGTRRSLERTLESSFQGRVGAICDVYRIKRALVAPILRD